MNTWKSNSTRDELLKHKNKGYILKTNLLFDVSDKLFLYCKKKSLGLKDLEVQQPKFY